jgi:hypothetical protein
MRRERVHCPNPDKRTSNFYSEHERRQALVTILLAVYRSIDTAGMEQRRLYNIWEEFANKLANSTGVKNKAEWLNELMAAWDIQSLDSSYAQDAAEALARFDDEELLMLIRHETNYLQLMLRMRKDKSDDPFADSSGELPSGTPLTIEKSYYEIPVLSGNSVRGLLRRIMMYDYCEHIGLDGMPAKLYHMLFTGGAITESTGKEQIATREEMIRLCPVLGLLGSAVGNQTIQGRLKTGPAQPVCKEHRTGDTSYWALLDRAFGTRMDSSKTEDKIKILDAEDGNPTQMKYEYEVLSTGTQLQGKFGLDADAEGLDAATLLAGIRLLEQYGYLGGQSARGMGEVAWELDTSALKASAQQYYEHIEQVAEQARQFWSDLDYQKEHLKQLGKQ